MFSFRKVLLPVPIALFLIVSSISGGGAVASTNSGGDLIIARTGDSNTMDKTTAVGNEDIWVFNQIFETLYTVAPDGKGVKPWLATSYDLTKDKKTYTFHLRHGVKFHNGQEMTAADVKFSIDDARATQNGWASIDTAIASINVVDKYTVAVKTKYPWSPLLADLALFANGIVPANYGGVAKAAFYDHPVGTGPFKWDHWTKGKDLKLVKNASYWQAGKPTLNSVTWTYVPDDNTRLLQVKSDQAQIDEYPPWSSISQLKSTPGLTVGLFPSTRTDYLNINEKIKPFNDVHVRRALSYAIDRKALVKVILFGNGKPANSFMPPTVNFYDPKSPGLQYDLKKAKAEMALSSVPHGFKATFEAQGGDIASATIAQILQAEFKPLGISLQIIKKDANANFTDWNTASYPGLMNQYWTMDIADPDELVSFSMDPSAGGHLFETWYKNPAMAKAAQDASKEFNPVKRQKIYSLIQKTAADDAFLGFLYYSPFNYVYSNKVHGFHPYPTGNYHLEDVTLTN